MIWFKMSVITISAFACLSYLASPAFGDSFVGVYEYKENDFYSGSIKIKRDGTSYFMDATSSSKVNNTIFSCTFTAKPQGKIVAGKAVVFKSDEFDLESRPPTITVKFENQELQVTDSNIFSSPFCGMNGSIGTGEYIKVK